MQAATGYGAALQVLGIASNAYGEHQGIKAMSRTAGRQNREQIAFDAQRQRQLGGYLDDTAPVGLAEGANAAYQTGVAGEAMQPGVVEAGAAELGIHAKPGINAASRADVRAGAMGRRIANDQLRRRRLGASLDTIEQDRENTELLYPEQMRRAAKTGQGYRQMGSYLGAGGQALSAYGMIDDGKATGAKTKYEV